MKNVKRHPDYFKIRNKIHTCEKPGQLESIKQLLLKFYNQHKQDGAELLALYTEKEADLNRVFDYEEDSIESLMHKKICGAH